MKKGGQAHEHRNDGGVYRSGGMERRIHSGIYWRAVPEPEAEERFKEEKEPVFKRHKESDRRKICMMLEEANKRLKKTQINEEQLWGLNSLYLLLDLQKDDFCKIVDTVGVETLLGKQNHYDRLLKAEDELISKERYLRAKSRLQELESEQEALNQILNNYNPFE